MRPTSSKITLGKEKKREQGGRKDEKEKSNGCTLSPVFFSVLATLEVVSADVFKNPA